jgi:hypothetical protein
MGRTMKKCCSWVYRSCGVLLNCNAFPNAVFSEQGCKSHTNHRCADHEHICILDVNIAGVSHFGICNAKSTRCQNQNRLSNLGFSNMGTATRHGPLLYHFKYPIDKVGMELRPCQVLLKCGEKGANGGVHPNRP